MPQCTQSSLRKRQNQMPKLENLLDMVAEKLDVEKREAWFSSVDITYAYGQVPLHLLTAQHYNFQIVRGDK